MGPLTENHRCPRGRLHRVTEALSTVAVGALIGIVLLYGIDEAFDSRPMPEMVMAAAALGAVLTYAVRQAVAGRP